MKKLSLSFIAAITLFANDNSIVFMTELYNKYFPNNIHKKNSTLSPQLQLSYEKANKLVGKYAIVYYDVSNRSYVDKLAFIEYDYEKKVIMGLKATKNGVIYPLFCFNGELFKGFDYSCVAVYSSESKLSDWYFFDVNNETLSGYEIFGTPSYVADALKFYNDRLHPLYGTLHNLENSSDSASSQHFSQPTQSSSQENYTSSSQSSYQCLPGYDCETANSSAASSCPTIRFGTVDDYFEGTVPGQEPVDAYTPQTVDKIVARVKQQCKENPQSCGIDAIPIIKEKTDPQIILNKVNNKPLDINGYYLHYGNGAFDWLYVPVKLKSAYKLEKGVDKDYSLRWTALPKDIKIEKQDKKIIIKK